VKGFTADFISGLMRRRTRRKRAAVSFAFFAGAGRTYVDAIGKAPVIMPVILAVDDIAANTVEDIDFFTVCHYAHSLSHFYRMANLLSAV
jgi:hypothetical protein